MSVVWLLLILGSVVAVLTNAWRHGNIDLTGKDANMRGVYARSIVIGVAVCALLRANLIDIVRNPDGPGLFIGWLNSPWNSSAPLVDQIAFVFEEVVGIIITGVVLAFAAKFWNDSFDIMYEFKRWLRGHANAMKPEPVVRSRSTVSRRPTRPPRSPRGRGGSGEGENRGRDSRDSRDTRDSRDSRGPRGPRGSRDSRDFREPRSSTD